MDAYVTDILMPYLVAHDRRPAAFVVYSSCCVIVMPGRATRSP